MPNRRFVFRTIYNWFVGNNPTSFSIFSVLVVFAFLYSISSLQMFGINTFFLFLINTFIPLGCITFIKTDSKEDICEILYFQQMLFYSKENVWFPTVLSSTIVFNIDNKCFVSSKSSSWFLKDHGTLKTEAMMLKIQLWSQE